MPNTSLQKKFKTMIVYTITLFILASTGLLLIDLKKTAQAQIPSDCIAAGIIAGIVNRVGALCTPYGAGICACYDCCANPNGTNCAETCPSTRPFKRGRLIVQADGDQVCAATLLRPECDFGDRDALGNLIAKPATLISSDGVDFPTHFVYACPYPDSMGLSGDNALMGPTSGQPPVQHIAYPKGKVLY